MISIYSFVSLALNAIAKAVVGSTHIGIVIGIRVTAVATIPIPRATSVVICAAFGLLDVQRSIKTATIFASLSIAV